MKSPQKPPPSNPNHDEHTRPYNLLPSHAATTPAHAIHHITSWASVAGSRHPNPHHVAYSEGRGTSSTRRYRRRTTRRHLLTTNTASISSLLSPLHTGTHTNDFHKRNITTLRRVHNKHRNTLIQYTTNNVTHHQEQKNNTDPNTDSQIERILAEINDLSDTFDITAGRIEQVLSDDETTDELISQFDHEIFLPFEATLQYALDKFATTPTTNDANENNNESYLSIIWDDDLSLCSCEYADINNPDKPHTPRDTSTNGIDTTNTITLMDLLLRYENQLPTPDPTNNARLSILPPWDNTTTNSGYNSHHSANHYQLPILPPWTGTPSRPDNNIPPTWTNCNNLQLHSANTHHQSTNGDEYDHFVYEHNEQQQQEPTVTNDIAPPSYSDNRHQQNKTNRMRKQKRRTRHTITTTQNKHNQPFDNKITLITQNVRGLPIGDDTKLQSLINQMKQHKWDAVCLQETWRLGDDEFYIDGYKVILKGNTTKNNDTGHVMGGVCIILSPDMDDAHRLANHQRISFPKQHHHEGRFIGVNLHFKKRDSRGKKIKGLMKIVLCSLYHPVDSREHEEFNGTTTTLLNRLSEDTQIIFGQDINCNVGTSNNTHDPFRPALGPNGINNRNAKGMKFLQHMCSLNMKIVNSFFVKHNYATWKNFKPSHPTYHMLDIFSVSSSFFKHVRNCGTIPFGVDNTDHTATAITIDINCIAYKTTKRTNTINGGRPNWHKITYDRETKEEFNSKLSTELSHINTTDDYTTFFDLVNNAAKSSAIEEPKQQNAWFEMSKDRIQPAIDRITSLHRTLRDPTNPNPTLTKAELQTAYRLRNMIVREAKSRYMSHIAQKISNLSGDNPRAMWKAIDECKLGHENNYKRPSTMKLTKEDGSKTTNDEENINIMRSHCEKLFNNKKLVSPNALDLIKQRAIKADLDNAITWKEFTTAINGLKNNKSPGENEIPAEAFKAMNNENKNHVFSFINSFWNGSEDYPEWHSGLGIPVQKVSHPTNPNQYRIVNLMDVGSKIFSRILTARLYKLLALHGTKYQFGATPNSGCQDANYTLKTLLHLRRQHNLETFVVFADLAKAFDTTDHVLISNILQRYGAPPRLVNSIERLYSNLHVTLKIGKESTDIDQTVGVRQGDNLSPVIFLFVMTAFSEILDKKWITAGLPRVEAEHTPLNKLSTGQLTGHIKPLTKTGTTTYVTHTLFLDDSCFPFNTREDAAVGTKLVKETFASLGLEMHCGTKETDKSKTEILWVPAPSFYTTAAEHSHTPQTTTTPNLPIEASNDCDPTADTHDESDNQISVMGLTTTKPKGRKKPLTFSTMTPQQREELYWNSPITNRINIDEDGAFIDFTAHFKYLGSVISFDLTDDKDINNRITKANQAMGALRHFWRNPYADLHAKKQIFLAIPANLLLWGCETWALRQSQIDKLNVFWHRAIRNILGIRMSEVIDDHITNERIRKIFHDIPDAEAILNARTMTYLGKTARSPDFHPPKLFMTAWVRNPRPKAGVLSTNKKTMVRSLNALLPDETMETVTTKCKSTGTNTTTRRPNPDGKLSNWLHIALDKPLWEWHIYKLTHPDSPLPPRPDPTRPRRQQRSTNEEEQDNANTQQNERQDNQRNDEEPRRANAQRNERQENQHRRNNTNNQRRNERPRQDPNRNDTPEPSQNHTRTDYNVQNVGRTRSDSLRALGLEINATNAEIKRRFRTLSLIYHPDKYNESIGITKTQATEHFQILNNAHDYLKDTH